MKFSPNFSFLINPQSILTGLFSTLTVTTTVLDISPANAVTFVPCVQGSCQLEITNKEINSGQVFTEDLVTGIKNLNVSGTLYDVKFEFGDFEDVFGSPSANDFFFDQNPGTAFEAAVAISEALGTVYATTSIRPGAAGKRDDFLVADSIGFNNNFINVFEDGNSGLNTDNIVSSLGAVSLPMSENFIIRPWAVFTVNTNVAPIPEPLTILGAGTAIAFGTGFKRKLGKAKKK